MFSRRVFLLVLFSFAAFARAKEDASPAAEVETEESQKKEYDSFSEEERAIISASQESHSFQAETSRLMDILINSLYSNRDIFIRELVSNAADALDKIRFMSLTNEGLVKDGEEELGIKVAFDDSHKTLTITDTGIGMTKEDLIRNLGTVARSGTSEFLDAASGPDSLNLIGQFGVGFYSVYLVADKVTVVSKHTDDDQYIWESSAQGVFTVSKDPRGNTLGRGTSVILHLKEDAEEYLEESKLTSLMTRYSQFINFPIKLRTVTKEEHEIEEDEEETAKTTEASEDDVEVGEEEEEEAPAKKTETVEVVDWKVLNDAKSIWMKNPKEVSEEEYNQFYETLTKDTGGSMEKIHFVADGEITFRAILYIPKKAPYNLYEKFYEKSTGLKLYVRRVLISDEFDEFLPRYMNFVRGIIDSDDLPLNVSRETLAQSRVLQVMAKKLTRKVLEMLRKIAETQEKAADAEAEEGADEVEDKYTNFWKEYGKSIKMGVMDDKKNKSKLLKLLRYKSSKSEGKDISLETYADRMTEDQNKIYYITCESTSACETNPVLEKFKAKDIEVLYMDEAIDEYVSQSIQDFDGIDFANVLRESASLPETKAFSKLSKSSDMTELIAYFKEQLGTKVAKVIVSNKLVSSPAVCSAPEYGWTGNMERIQRAQAMQRQEDMAMHAPQKNFEFNPYHPIIKEINRRRKEDPEDATLTDLVHILYESASVVAGYSMGEPETFAKRIHKVISLGLDVDPEAQMGVEVEEPEEAETTEDETTEDETTEDETEA